MGLARPIIEGSELVLSVRRRHVMPDAQVVVALRADHGDVDACLLRGQVLRPRVHTVETDRVWTLVVPAPQHVPSLPRLLQKVRAYRSRVSLAVDLTDDG